MPAVLRRRPLNAVARTVCTGSPPDCFLCGDDPNGLACDSCGRTACGKCLERCQQCGKDVCLRGMYDKTSCEDCAKKAGRDVYAETGP